jgi:hypothetical protein
VHQNFSWQSMLFVFHVLSMLSGIVSKASDYSQQNFHENRQTVYSRNPPGFTTIYQMVLAALGNISLIVLTNNSKRFGEKLKI